MKMIKILMALLLWGCGGKEDKIEVWNIAVETDSTITYSNGEVISKTVPFQQGMTLYPGQSAVVGDYKFTTDVLEMATTTDSDTTSVTTHFNPSNESLIIETAKDTIYMQWTELTVYFNYETNEYDHLSNSPTSWRPYIPQSREALAVYDISIEMGETPQEAAFKVLSKGVGEKK